jgi:hypothetical protein
MKHADIVSRLPKSRSIKRPSEAIAETSLFREVPSFPSYNTIANGDLFSLSLSDRSAGLTHGLHRFPAKYVARVPAWIIDQFATPNAVVLDPFCGSGTTLVEALTRTDAAIGVDLDPLACLISRSKTAAIPASRVEALGKELKRTWRTSSKRLCPPMPDLVRFKHWFSEKAWGDLQALRDAILRLECTEVERDFIICVFSSVIRWVSNADDQTQKTYVSGTLKKQPPEVAPTFWRAYGRAVAGLTELQQVRLPEANSTVVIADATDLPMGKHSVDLIVTSPPYLDSVDYMYNFMLEYFWLGPLLGVADRKTFNQMRRLVTGAKNPPKGGACRLPTCLQDMISLSAVSAHRATATVAYFESMSRHFASAAKVLKPGCRYVLVVGNSQTQDDMLPMHDALIRLAIDAGLTFEKSFAYRIRRHYMKFPRAGRGGVITMDWVIVLRKDRTRGCYPDRLPLPAFTHRPDQVAN